MIKTDAKITYSKINTYLDFLEDIFKPQFSQNLLPYLAE